MATPKDLTLIKVPGKNKRHHRSTATGAAKKPRTFALKASKDLKTPVSYTSPHPIAQSRSKHRSLKHIKSKRDMSLLEKLPQELLERVFLYCRELNLPRASPILAVKLSSEHIFTRTMIAAASPYWGRRCVISSDDEEEERDPEELPNASPALSAILRCRWATLQRWRTAEKIWLQSAIKLKDPKAHQDGEVRPLLVVPLPEEDVIEGDYEDFATKITSLTFLDWWRPAHEGTKGLSLREPLLRFPGQVDIPITLLSGPWTEEDIKYLFYLWKIGAEIETRKSTAGEEAQQGLQTAILTSNIHVIYLLHHLGISIPFTTSLLAQCLSNTSTTNDIMLSYFKYHFKGKYDIDQNPIQRAERAAHIAQLERIRNGHGRPPIGTLARLLRDEEDDQMKINKRKAEVEREVQQLRRQGLKVGNQEVLNWADTLESIYEMD